MTGATFLRQLLVLIVVFLYAPYVSAQWQVGEAVDSMTDEKLIRVVTRNPDGFLLGIVQIGRTKDVHLLFGLPDSSSERLSPGKYLVYRVDKRTARDFQRISGIAAHREMAAQREARRTEPRLIVVEPRWFSGALWTPNDSVGSLLSVYEIMEGNQLRVRYVVSGERQRETVFDLTGAAPAIARALGIPQRLDDAKRRELSLARAERHAANACIFGLTDDAQTACHKKHIDCAQRFDMDYDEFLRCVGWN